MVYLCSMKKAYNLHDKYTEEIIGTVLTNSPIIWETWEEFHNYECNSNLENFDNCMELFLQFCEGKISTIEQLDLDFIQI